MSYLNSSVYTVAESPATLCDIPFLGEQRQTPYFRAFQSKRLSIENMLVLLKQHIIQAANEANWKKQDIEQASVFIGSTSYNVADCELLYLEGIDKPFGYHLNELSDGLKKEYPQQTIYNFATSCTSSAYALIQAHRQLQSGMISHAFVIGIESFNLLTLAHFYSMGLLGECYQPFVKEGFILGEGVACLALSNKPSQDLQMKLIATQTYTDSTHLAETKAECLQALLNQILIQAKISPEQINIIKAHAVGSQSSDEAELAVLNSIKGIDQAHRIWFKHLIGHTLGASTAIEMALLHPLLKHLTLPKNIVSDGIEKKLPPDGICLTNFFGFGGNYTAMLWQWHHE